MKNINLINLDINLALIIAIFIVACANFIFLYIYTLHFGYLKILKNINKLKFYVDASMFKKLKTFYAIADLSIIFSIIEIVLFICSIIYAGILSILVLVFLISPVFSFILCFNVRGRWKKLIKINLLLKNQHMNSLFRDIKELEFLISDKEIIDEINKWFYSEGKSNFDLYLGYRRYKPNKILKFYSEDKLDYLLLIHFNSMKLWSIITIYNLDIRHINYLRYLIAIEFSIHKEGINDK